MTPAIGTTLNGSENIGAGPLLGVKRKLSYAPRQRGFSSVPDPTVWTGRALQAESCERQKLVLLYCIGPLVKRLAPGHHGYPRASGLNLG